MKITKQMQREFWKHGINPITGWKVDSRADREALSKRYYLQKYSSDFNSEIDLEDDLEDELEYEVIEIDCTFDENFEELMQQIDNL